MGFLRSLFGIGKKSIVVHRRLSKHDKLKAWSKTKPQSFWDAKNKKR